MMTYEEALSYIHSLTRFRADAGLDRMRRLMDLLGNPQNQLKCVHVVGTNGKGSTCAVLSSILHEAGYKTGLFTSPFILDFCERMQTGGKMIPRERLAALTEQVKPFAEQIGEIKEFEFITALAFLWFAEQNCDITVLEAGMGGASDPTNLIPKPLAAVITSIGLDHTEVLGDTVEKIAREKSGIIKEGALVVTCPNQDPQAFAVIREQTLARHGVLIQENLEAVGQVHSDISGTDLCWQGLHLHIPLAGKHQISNTLTALAAIKQLSKIGFPRLSDSEVLVRGVAAARIPARMELLSRDPLVILDGAHNPQGAAALADALSLLDGRPVTAVMGMLADKNVDETLRVLAPRFARMICVTPHSLRALDAHELAARADRLGLRASAAHSAAEAWELSRAVAAAEHGAVVICGSLYLASELRAVAEAEQ